VFSELPEYSAAYQQSIDENGEIRRYNTLMQITIVNDAYVFSLDKPESPTQIATIDSIDLLMDPAKMLNLGFRPQIAELDEEKND